MLHLNTFTGCLYYKRESEKQEFSSYAADATYSTQIKKIWTTFYCITLHLEIYGTCFCVFFGVYWINATILKGSLYQLGPLENWQVVKILRQAIPGSILFTGVVSIMLMMYISFWILSAPMLHKLCIELFQAFVSLENMLKLRFPYLLVH